MNEQRAGRRRYEVTGTLGRGGFGTVYQAQLLGEEGFRKTVALKVLNRGLLDQPELAARLRDEARILGLIRHRAVVQVDDLVRLDGAWTIVMEYVGGADLGSVLKLAPVPPRPALEILQEAASALHVAWTAPGPDGRPLNLLHRDLKPGNLLVTPAGEVKVLDFGIARAEFGEREGVTRSVGFGSPEYMSPERLEWQNGPESDIYALGCVLYELLTGTRFGISSGHPDRHQARVEEAAQNLGRLLGPSGEPVALLLRQLLAYEPAERPSARALERQCEGLVAAISGERLRDWAEREIPTVIAARPLLEEAGVTGRILVEGTSGAALSQAPAAGAPLPWMALGLLGGVVVVAATGLVVWLALRQDPVSTPPPAQPEAKASPVAAPASPDPAPAQPAPTEPAPAKAEPAPTPVAASASSASSAARARSNRPSAEASASGTTGRVGVSGDASAVELVSGDRTYKLPGSVPAGTYTVSATFPGREPVLAGQISVVAGTESTLNCSAAFKLCRAR